MLRDRRKLVADGKLAVFTHDASKGQRIVTDACQHRRCARKDFASLPKFGTVTIELKTARRNFKVVLRDANISIGAWFIAQATQQDSNLIVAWHGDEKHSVRYHAYLCSEANSG